MRQAFPHADQPALWLRDPRHYLDVERGDLFMALGRYNGSRGRPDIRTLVLGAQGLEAPGR